MLVLIIATLPNPRQYVPSEHDILCQKAKSTDVVTVAQPIAVKLSATFQNTASRLYLSGERQEFEANKHRRKDVLRAIKISYSIVVNIVIKLVITMTISINILITATLPNPRQYVPSEHDILCQKAKSTDVVTVVQSIVL